MKCSGKGPPNKAQEYETVSCAVEKGKTRNIEGPFKVSIGLEGYPASGGAPRKAGKAGVATFTLRDPHGTFGIYVDAGELTNLYYIDSHPLTL